MIPKTMVSSLIIIMLISHQGAAQSNMVKTNGSVVLNVDNNWAFSARTTKLLSGSIISLEWTSSNRTTGWITCNEENQIATTILEGQLGNLTLITEESKTCGIAVYRIDKPHIDQKILVEYVYSWIPHLSDSDEERLDFPISGILTFVAIGLPLRSRKVN